MPKTLSIILSIIMRSILCICLVSLSGCSLLFPAKPYNPTLNTLDNNGIVNMPICHNTGKTLLILPVISNQQINNTRMYYVLRSHQVSYFRNNIWAATPAQMLQPLIAQALINSHHFSAVASAPFLGSVDYKLYVQLLTLQQNFTAKPSFVTLGIAAQVVATGSGRIVGASQFHVVVPAPVDNPYGGVLAANQATSEILHELAGFVIAVTSR